MNNPAKQLLGETLEDGWRVVEEVTLGAHATGGRFSAGYIVERDGHKAFLKALDYSSALAPGVDTPAELQKMTSAYLFERDLLERCGARKMDKVVRAVGRGQVKVSEDLGGQVDYLLFELADGDIRNHMAAAQAINAAWSLRALHNVAVGLAQLHSEFIAHQDLKPSNVLVFKGNTSKVGDLGRATLKGVAGPHDDRRIPGDCGYAAPEALYGEVSSEWATRRLGCDLYHLGSMIVFLFANVSMTALIATELPSEFHFTNYRGFYKDVLPFVRDAMDRALERVAESIPEPYQVDVLRIVRELCEPDPARRGHPKNLLTRANQHSLVRYISAFNLLASRAENAIRSRTT